MVKFELDNNRNVVIKNDGCIMIVTAYSYQHKAIRVGFTYLMPAEMLKQIDFIFNNYKNILSWLVKSGKVKNIDDTYTIDNICFYYGSKKIIVNKSNTKKEIQKMLV